MFLADWFHPLDRGTLHFLPEDMKIVASMAGSCLLNDYKSGAPIIKSNQVTLTGLEIELMAPRV